MAPCKFGCLGAHSFLSPPFLGVSPLLMLLLLVPNPILDLLSGFKVDEEVAFFRPSPIIELALGLLVWSLETRPLKFNPLAFRPYLLALWGVPRTGDECPLSCLELYLDVYGLKLFSIPVNLLPVVGVFPWISFRASCKSKSTSTWADPLGLRLLSFLLDRLRPFS